MMLAADEPAGTEKEHTAAVFSRTPLNPGIAVAEGFGLALTVTGGQLVIRDGVGSIRRVRKYPRAGRKLRRVIVLGHDGYLSLSAIRWCRDTGVSLAVIGNQGELQLITLPPGVDDSRIRRAQATSAGTPAGLDIVRCLLVAKLEKQAAVLAGSLEAPADAARLRHSAEEMSRAPSEMAARIIEREAAKTYWQAWRRLAVRWARRDQKRIPDHWAEPFTGRFSRPAVTPINALLHYCYAIAEIEVRVACQVLGLDPGLGFLHTDERNRQSLALDLIETIRPDVDAYLIGMLAGHVFRHRDFAEANDGACRILAPLTHDLAEQGSKWAAAVAPEAESVLTCLAAIDDRIPIRTPLSGSQLKASVAATVVRTAPGQKAGTSARTRSTRPVKPPLPNCVECGKPMADRQRKSCEACSPALQVEKTSRMIAAGVAAARRRAAEGIGHPQHSLGAKQLRSVTLTAQRAANIAWDAAHAGAEPSPEIWAEIATRLQSVPVAKMAAVTGLSSTHCSRIRQGLRVPHPRHWFRLAELAEGDDLGPVVTGS